jgi:hypothetical protein
MECIWAAVFASCMFEPVAEFYSLSCKVVGHLVPAGSRVRYLLLYNVTSHINLDFVLITDF